MSIVYVLVVLVIIGVGLWYTNARLPPEKACKILSAVIVIATVFWMLEAFGVFGASPRLPPVR